jgi:hypothetical protein
MDNQKRSIKELLAEIKRSNKALSEEHIEILGTLRSLHRRLDAQKMEWIAQGKHSKEEVDECNELTNSIGTIVRQRRLLQESFNSDKSEIERHIAQIPGRQMELKLDAVRRLRDLTVTYLNEGIVRERQILFEVASRQEELEAFVSSLRGR